MGLPLGPHWLRRRGAGNAHDRALLAMAEFVRHPQPGLLDRAVMCLDRAVELLPARDPVLPEYLSLLGNALSQRFDHLGDPADIDRSVAVHRRAVAAAVPGSPLWAQVRLGLGNALFNIFKLRTSLEAWEEATACYREAMTAPEADDDVRTSAMANLSTSLTLGHTHPDRQKHLDESLSLLAKLIEITPADHPYYLSRVIDLANTLIWRVDLPERSERLEPLLAILRERLPDADPLTRRQAALMVGDVLRDGPDSVFGKPTTAQLIEVFRRLVRALPAGHALLPDYLAQLAHQMAVSAEALGTIEVLDEVITAVREALTAMPDPRPARATLMSVLGATLGRRMEITGSAADLRDVVQVLRAACAELPADHPDRGPHLSNLGNALRLEYHLRPRDELLAEALETHRRALRETPADHPARAMVLTNLGGTLVYLFERRGDLRLLDEGIAMHRDAVRLTPDVHPYAGLCLSNLGAALVSRFETTGELTDLDDAITQLRHAAELTGEDHAHRGARLSALGSALMHRANHVGDSGALDEATRLLRRAVSATGTGGIWSAGVHKNAATILMHHPSGKGDPVELLRTALAMAGAAPSRSSYLSSLGMALLARVQDGISAQQDSLMSSMTRNLDDTAILDELTMAELVRRTRSLPDRPLPPELADNLAEAVKVLREAVDSAPADHPQHPFWQASLGTAMHLRARLEGRPRELDKAVELMGAALDSIPKDSRRRAYVLTDFAQALKHQAESNGTAERQRAIVEALREAALIEAAPATWRAMAARDWGRAAADSGDFASAMTGFATAVGLLDLVAWRGLDRDDQERLLADCQGIAGDAAACALQAGRAELAVELLEQGRGVLLAQALDTRAEHDDLRDRAPELAERLARVSAGLDDGTGPASSQPAAVDRRHQLARERDETLAEIRRLPGFEDFLRPPAFSGLAKAAEGGPVVLVNVSRYRCDALVIDRGAVQVVPLAELTSDEVATRAVRFTTAVEVLNSGDGGSLDARLRAREVIGETLRWIWHAMTGPVLDGIGITSAGQPWTRLWWCPTGQAVFLPLHASGDHSTRRAERPATVIDRVVSSYTPTVRALARLRAQEPPRLPDQARPLLVSMPNTPGFPYLPGAVDEAEDFLDRFPAARALVEESAIRDAVMGLLDVSPWVHFACHAVQAPGSPSRAWLVLQDQPVTIRDLVALRLSSARLAVLSCCDTARGDEDLADEAITVAAAMHLAGYPHVIAAQWMVADSTAAEFSPDVYGQLTGDDGQIDTAEVAFAVHEAVRRLRDSHPLAPLLWAPYMHTGP